MYDSVWHEAHSYLVSHYTENAAEIKNSWHMVVHSISTNNSVMYYVSILLHYDSRETVILSSQALLLETYLTFQVLTVKKRNLKY
jgi:hypothetical protein